MDPKMKREQQHEVVNSPGQRREIVTERTVREAEKTGLSPGTIALIAILAVAAIGVIVYLVSNRNANESANRNANVAVASQSNPQQPPVIVQQPAPAQQAPVIIQQPAPAQQAPVIVQQPAPSSQRQNTSANDDANMQDIATKRLTQEPDMAAVVMSINDARAVLTGTVSSAAAKAKAEQLVKAVRGVKSVANKIVVSG
jgi:type IV secretory pathway VirB10-like protein